VERAGKVGQDTARVPMGDDKRRTRERGRNGETDRASDQSIDHPRDAAGLAGQM
jgi:hypothetical protein